MFECRPLKPPLAMSRCAVIVGSLFAAAPASAESWRILPSASVTATATNNTGYDDGRRLKGDVILDLAPQLEIEGRGGKYRLDASFGFDGLVYTRNTHDDEIIPQGQLKFKSTLVDRWVYFDASARIAQTADNPFAGRAEGATSDNRLTTVAYDLTPYIDHDFTPTLNFTARSQWGWNRREKLRDIDLQNHQIRLQQISIPTGWAFEWTGQRTHYQGDDDPVLALSALRAIGLYSPETRWKLGLIAGRERSEFGGADDSDGVYGFLLEAAPTERTLASATVERRFFGTGWNAALRHRSPYLGLTAQWVRRPTAQANTYDVASTTAPAQLLDALLITRYPDPAERAEIVRETMARLALPRLSNAIEINAQSAQLEQGSRVTALLQGRVMTVSMSAYLSQLTPLSRADSGPAPVIEDSISSRQHGVSLDLNRRLDPLTAASIYFEVSQLRQLDQAVPDTAHDRTLRFTLTRELGPNTTVSGAVRRRLRNRVLDGSRRSDSETGLIVGMSYRF